MWVHRLLLSTGQVDDADRLHGSELTNTSQSIPAPRALLVHIVVDEDQDHHEAYRSMLCFALHLDSARATGQVNMLQPILDLDPDEQAPIRAWLIARRWPAWARADPLVRQLLGIPDPPILLAEAARHWMIPIQTLARAAREERLPTIRAGDRQLVYLTTIHEAQQRGLLHHTVGRPRRT